MEMVRTLSSQHAVVIFSKTTCCMCHTIKSLFNELGVSPVVHELDQDPKGTEIELVLLTLLGRRPTVPAVFIGRELIGGPNEVMTLQSSSQWHTQTTSQMCRCHVALEMHMLG